MAHSRTEQADYGLAEVIVATDENLKLKDFSFQRCRSRYRKQFESKSIRSVFRGKTSVELSAMLQPEAVDRFPGHLRFGTTGRAIAERFWYPPSKLWC